MVQRELHFGVAFRGALGDRFASISSAEIDWYKDSHAIYLENLRTVEGKIVVSKGRDTTN